MGRYEYYVTEEGPSLTKPAEEFDYVTYQECIEFLDHLIKRGRVLVDKKVRGLFRIFDVTEHDMAFLRRIKRFSSAEEAYDAIAKSLTPVNCNHKLMQDLNNIYMDELYEYLVENEVKNADKLAMIIASGGYKEYRKHNPQVLSYDFDQWARACHFIPARKMFKRTFWFEYKLWQNKITYEKMTSNVKEIIFHFEDQDDLEVKKDDVVNFEITDIYIEKPNMDEFIILMPPAEIKWQHMIIKIKSEAVDEWTGKDTLPIINQTRNFNDVTSITIRHNDGETDEIIVRKDDETKNYQNNSYDMRDGQLTGVFMSSFIFEYERGE